MAVPVPAINQLRWQNPLFFVDPEVICNFVFLSSDSSEIENAIQLQSVLRLCVGRPSREAGTYLQKSQTICEVICQVRSQSEFMELYKTFTA